MVDLACRQGPRLLLKRFIVPPASALPRKLKKSKKSRVVQNYTSWPHTRLGLRKPIKKQPEWQHLSSGAPTGPSRNVEAHLCPGPGPKPPAFSSLRPRSPPPPSFDNNRGLAADSKTCTRNSEWEASARAPAAFPKPFSPPQLLSNTNTKGQSARWGSGAAFGASGVRILTGGAVGWRWISAPRSSLSGALAPPYLSLRQHGGPLGTGLARCIMG